MDSLIDLGGRRVRLSSIRFDQRSRASFLAGPYNSGSPVRCLCTAVPVEMGVALRRDPSPTFYLYHLHRGDPLLHDVKCPHRVEAGLDLVAPLGTDLPPAPQAQLHSQGIVVHTPVLEPQPIVKPTQPVLTGVPALLEALLLSSGLTAWHPGFARYRNYAQARFRLIEASKRIRPFGACTLADILYFPPVFDPARKEQIELEFEFFRSQLQPTEDNMRPRGVVLGRLRSIERKASWKAPLLKLAESKVAYWLDDCPELISEPNTQDYAWLVMLVVEASNQSSSGLRVVDAAAVRITPQWIPVWSAQHALLANDLVANSLSFTASLITDPSTSWAHPSFVAIGDDGSPHAVFPSRLHIQQSAGQRSSISHAD